MVETHAVQGINNVLHQHVYHKTVCLCVCVRSCVSELQTIVDGLLTDKLLLEQQMENLTKEGAELRQQV